MTTIKLIVIMEGLFNSTIKLMVEIKHTYNLRTQIVCVGLHVLLRMVVTNLVTTFNLLQMHRQIVDACYKYAVDDQFDDQFDRQMLQSRC